MEHAISTSMTRRSTVAALALAIAPMIAVAGADSAQAATGKSLYERLGGVFAIAAVVDHFSDAVVKNPIVGQESKNPQLQEWHTKNLEDCPDLNSCGRCGSATFREALLSTPPPSPARRRSALRQPTGICGFPLPNSMRWQQSSGARSTSSRCRRGRRTKSWQPSPPTKARLPQAAKAKCGFRLLPIGGLNNA